MEDFWGRQREIAALREHLGGIRRTGRGRMVAMRGRRQAGKSRLLTHFAENAGVPYLYATAIKNANTPMQLMQLVTDAQTSRQPLPNLAVAFAAPPATWTDFLARLPQALDGQPAVIVLDEFPWASETDDTLEGVLQNAWDRVLEHLPVLVILVGSDLAMMQRLTEHDRPLFGRATEMVINALSPAEVAEAFPPGRAALDVLDLYLATGGFPRLVLAAREHRSAKSFVAAQLQDDQSPLSVTGLRLLDAEFRQDLNARTVLEAIGGVTVGHATFSSAVALLSGDEGAAGTAMSRALPTLTDSKRIVSIDLPVGAKLQSKLRRYRITDPYLKFWFRYCNPHLADIARGRADLAVDHFTRDFASWRGIAIEPIVRDAVLRLAAHDSALRGIEQVGAWWNRSNEHEIDVVTTDRFGHVPMIGTIKWRARKAVSAGELAQLAQARAVVPGATSARLMAVCPAGASSSAAADVVLGADDVLNAFR